MLIEAGPLTFEFGFGVGFKVSVSRSGLKAAVSRSGLKAADSRSGFKF
jgi:hypothetical protein